MTLSNRRRLLLGAGIALTASAGAGWYLWPDEGLFNPCRGALPAELQEHDIVRAAWHEIEPQRCWDCHVHLIGIGDGRSGVWINPRMQSMLHPGEFARRVFFLNAGCAHEAPGSVDERYVERLHSLIDGLADGAKLMLLAFDYTYTAAAERDIESSAFHTPDAYAAALASRHPRHFEWAASIHPYRRDCVEALGWALKYGARAVKWLPAAMGIDPASALCDRFYAAAARLDIPILTHCGEERAVYGVDRPALGNPLKLRRALDHGVRVVVAHCASMGEDQDLDRGPNAPVVRSFQLFERLMDNPDYVGRLFGDLSAIPQVNRVGPALHRILQRAEWHPRLLNGSDYPLPGVMPLFSVDALIDQRLIDSRAGPVLKALRAYNPLLFDFVLKRELHSGARKLSPAVFHTRDFFRPQRDTAGQP